MAYSVGQMVSWDSSGGRATGKITRVVRNGKINVPNSDFTITGTSEDPAVLIRIYRDGKPTDTMVGHKMSTLSSAKKFNKGYRLYDMLKPQEKAFHDALQGVVNKFGPYDQPGSGVWVGYISAEDNEDAAIGVKCGNCSFYGDGGRCSLLSYLVEENAICRLAAIPDNLINETMEAEKMTKQYQGCGCPECMTANMHCEKCAKCMGMYKQYQGCGCPECMAEDIPCSECDQCTPPVIKSDTYTPNAGMKSAARRALKWKEDGKATGAGTPVGWGRATDIVAGRSMSISTVRRMYSFFSRHEVDKKGKDFYNTSNPSNGRIMWDAWGGDAGFSWSRGIVERDKAKKVWKNSPLFR